MSTDLRTRGSRRDTRRPRWRRIRQSTLGVAFLGVAIWGWLTYRADHHVFAWDGPVRVAFVALLDQASGEDDASDARFVDRFLSRVAPPHDSLRAVEDWIERERQRHSGDEHRRFEFAVRGPLRVTTPPPAPPANDSSFWERLHGTRALMAYFEEIASRDELFLASYDVTVFVYFYDFYDQDRSRIFGQLDSIANRRTRTGIVFAPISTELRGNTCAVIAHELCHTLGASDKYDDGHSVFPDGFVAPRSVPLYPQRSAEIMALGRPVAPGRDELVTDLEDCRVGPVSAVEMNWRPEALKDAAIE